MSVKNKYLFFTLIIIVNVILKSIYLDHNPFWYDEMISIKDTQLDFGHIKHEAEWDNNPPFYYYCLWIWHSIIPVSEFNSRILSVLFISIAIGLVFLFTNKYFGNRTAIVSSVLLTLSNFIFYYSQETRVYALILLLSIISTIQFFKYLEMPKLYNLIILSILNFLLIYSHYIAGMMIFFQYVIILFFYKKNNSSFFIIQSLLIITLVLLRFTKKQFLNIANFNKKDDFWLKTADFKDLTSAFFDLYYNPITAFVFIAVILFFVFTFFRHKTDIIKSHLELYCLLVGFISVIILFFIGTFKPVFLSRYLIFSVPFATILVVHYLFKIKRVGLFIVLFLVGFQTYSLNLIKKEQSDYRSVAFVVNEYRTKDDFVIINTKDNLNLFLYYSYNRFLNFKASDSICMANNIFALNEVNDLKKINYSNNSNVFLIQSFHDLKSNDNSFKKYFDDKGAKIFSTKFYKSIEFTVYKTGIK
jgi:uncharacterized membrane protein